jgi:hypothetical protein
MRYGRTCQTALRHHPATAPQAPTLTEVVIFVTKTLGVACKKQEIYLALVEDGEVVAANPQRLEVAAVHEQTARLKEFMHDFGRVLAEIEPDAVHIIQPETNYEATYSALAPKAALETLIRLACLDADVKVELIHRAAVRSALGGGKLDELIEAKIEPVGKYWNVGRKYAAAVAMVERKRK